MVKRHLDQPFAINNLQLALQRLDSGSSVESDDVIMTDEYLRRVAQSGNTSLPWETVKGLFSRRLKSAFDEILIKTQDSEDRGTKGFTIDDSAGGGERRAKLSAALDSVDERRLKMLSPCHDTVTAADRRCQLVENVGKMADQLKNMDGAPFTIQRLAELLIEPNKHYKRADKYFRALEKNLLIVTTVGPDGCRSIDNQSEAMMTSTPTESSQDAKRPRIATDVDHQSENGVNAADTTDLSMDTLADYETSPTPEYVELAPSDDHVESSMVTSSVDSGAAVVRVSDVVDSMDIGTDDEVTSSIDKQDSTIANNINEVEKQEEEVGAKMAIECENVHSEKSNGD